MRDDDMSDRELLATIATAIYQVADKLNAIHDELAALATCGEDHYMSQWKCDLRKNHEGSHHDKSGALWRRS